MSEQYIPGDVQVKTVSLFSRKGTVNLTELVQYISIYESILTPGVVVEIAINDTRNILSNLPILGAERMRLEIETPTRKTKKIDLVVGDVRDGTSSINLKSKTFVIEAVTPEVLIDKSIQISKSYNTNISRMISDIATTFLKTKKKVDVQTTRGIQKIIIPSKNPFDAINMLRLRSMSSEDKSSMYVFFENDDGFHFKTIEKLFSDGEVGDRVFFEDPTSRTDMKLPSFRNIITREEQQQFNVNDRIKSGGLAHEIKQFDMKTLEYKSSVVKFDHTKYKSADGKLQNPDDSELASRYGSKAGSNSMVWNDTGSPDTFISDGLGARRNMVNLYGQGSINLEVFGDSELTAGQLIELNLPDNVSITTAPKNHEQLSGKYLIAFLRHIIAPEGNMPRYTCSIEAIKGGYKRSV